MTAAHDELPGCPAKPAAGAGQPAVAAEVERVTTQFPLGGIAELPLPSDDPAGTQGSDLAVSYAGLPLVLPAIPAASVTPEPTDRSAPTRAVSSEQHPVAVSCPECGAPAMVELTRRDALDFCSKCDFPLFWARDQVVISEPLDSNDDALRRLPGTLGRVVIASTPCPHCNEPNLPTAALCVRCGLSMQASAPPAPPVPRPEPVVEAPLESLEDASNRWWIWLLVLLTVLLVAGIVLLAAQPWQ